MPQGMSALYPLTLLLKLVGVCLYAGGMTTSFIATAPQERKRAVHAIASPALVLTWLCGYLLSVQRGIALTELWIVAGLLLSLASQLSLVYAVARDDQRTAVRLAALLPFAAVLALMIFRPTWAGLFS